MNAAHVIIIGKKIGNLFIRIIFPHADPILKGLHFFAKFERMVEKSKRGKSETPGSNKKKSISSNLLNLKVSSNRCYRWLTLSVYATRPGR